MYINAEKTFGKNRTKKPIFLLILYFFIFVKIKKEKKDYEENSFLEIHVKTVLMVPMIKIGRPSTMKAAGPNTADRVAAVKRTPIPTSERLNIFLVYIDTPLIIPNINPNKPNIPAINFSG